MPSSITASPTRDDQVVPPILYSEYSQGTRLRSCNPITDKHKQHNERMFHSVKCAADTRTKPYLAKVCRETHRPPAGSSPLHIEAKQSLDLGRHAILHHKDHLERQRGDIWGNDSGVSELEPTSRPINPSNSSSLRRREELTNHERRHRSNRQGLVDDGYDRRTPVPSRTPCAFSPGS